MNSKELFKTRMDLPKTRHLYGDGAWNAVMKSPNNLKYVEGFTSHLVSYAVFKKGTSIQYVPEKFMSEEVCLKAVTSDPMALEYIPSHLQTKAVAKKALEGNCKVIKYISSKCFSQIYNEMKKKEGW